MSIFSRQDQKLDQKLLSVHFIISFLFVEAFDAFSLRVPYKIMIMMMAFSSLDSPDVILSG